MSYMLKKSHPENGDADADEAAELLKNGEINKIDFSKWRPVKIKAYVGTREKKNVPPMPTPKAVQTAQMAMGPFGQTMGILPVNTQPQPPDPNATTNLL